MNALVKVTGPHAGAVKFEGRARPAWRVAVIETESRKPQSKVYLCLSYGVRSPKRREDIMEDAEDGMPQRAGPHDAPLPNAGGRKPRAKRQPETTATPNADELRHSEVLRLMPPSSLEQAEQHYRELIKAYHTDTNPPTPENHRKTVELNEAIEYFRKIQVEG